MIAALRPVLRDYPRQVGLLVVLGSVAGVCEGIGISLFLPLLHSMDPESFANEAGGMLGRWSAALLRDIAPAWRLQVVLGAMFGLLALKALLSAVNGLLFARLDARLVDDLRQRVLDQALRVRLGFVERHRMGDLLALLQSQTWETSGALATLIGIAIRLMTISVFGLALLLISWQLTLAVAVALLSISWVVRRISRRVDHLSEAGMRQWNGLVQRCVEVLRGLRTTLAYGREDDERSQFARISRATSEAFWRVEKLRALVDPMSELMVAIMLAAVLLLSLNDPSRLPAVLTFMFILFRLQPQVQRLDAARVKIATLTAPVRAVTEFIADGDKPYLATGNVPFQGLREGIRLQDVSYRYDSSGPGAAALQDITATIPALKTTAIVGPSGAGKSTLTYLLMRFADPATGTIWIDEHKLTDLEIRSWRREIALVSQDAHIFHDTVAANIRYGQMDASDEQVRDAARRAHAHEFVEALADGYETVLGENGLQLSGGQRQRIALARALVRSAKILVLDEATNALDAIAENLIQEALAELSGKCTMIVIAHRLPTIEKADHILVLDRGVLVESGARADLITDAGLFSRLHAMHYGSTP